MYKEGMGAYECTLRLLGDSKSLSPTARGNFMKNMEMSYIHMYSHNRDSGYF